MSRVKTLTTKNAATGKVRVSTPKPMTKPSSAKLKAQFETGSGLVFTAARVPAFVRCAPAATDPPSSAISPSVIGVASPNDVTARKAPPSGRITVWTTSQAESTQGILSAKNSTTYRTSARPMTRLLSKTANWDGRSTHPNREASPRIATVA